jgi:hypothetical protein
LSSPHRRPRFLAVAVERKSALPRLHGQQDSAFGNPGRASKVDARRADRPCVVLCALGLRQRPFRKLHSLPQAHRRGLWLGPRPSGFRLFADGACQRAVRTPNRPAVRPFGSAHGLCTWSLAARRRVHDRRLFGAPLAIPAFDRPLCRDRHRPDRQRSKLNIAGPLVRTTAANRDGRDLLRDRRGGPDPGAGLPNLDRACGLARRI